MNDNGIDIITLDPVSWKKLKDIRLESLKFEPQAFNSAYKESLEYPDEYWRNKLTDKNEIHLFARYGNSIIGTINATMNERGEDEETAVIHGAYINGSFRKKGVGRLLITRLLEQISGIKNIHRIKLWVKDTQIPAIQLYRSVGFSHLDMAGKHTLVMEMHLQQKP